MKRILLSCFSALLLLAANAVSAPQAAAQEMQPLLLLSFKGLDELVNDLNYIGELSGNPDLGGGLEGLLSLFTGGQEIEGVDKSKPWGAAISSDGLEFRILAFMPIKNLEQFLNMLGAVGGQAQDEGDGLWKIEVQNFGLFFKQKGDWTYASISADLLQDLPEDASTLTKGLDTKHDLAVQAHIQNIPEIFRQLLVEQVRQGMSQAMQQQEGESDVQFSLREKIIGQQFEGLTESMNNLDVVSLGASIDTKAKLGVVDITETAVAGSELAKQMALMSGQKAKFGGFHLPDATVSATACMPMGAGQVAQLTQMIDGIRDELFKQAASQGLDGAGGVADTVKELLNELFSVAKSTFDGGKTDAGLCVLGEGPFTIALGGYSGKSENLQKVVEKLSQTLETEVGFYGLQIDAAKHKEVRFHSVQVPLPGGEIGDTLTTLFGFDLELTFGVGPDSVFVAMGKDSIDTVKKILDQSEANASKPAQPIQAQAKVAPLLKLLAAGENANETVTAVSGEIEAGKDKVFITSSTVPNGMTIHIEAQEGLLKVLPTLVQSLPMPAGIPGF